MSLHVSLSMPYRLQIRKYAVLYSSLLVYYNSISQLYTEYCKSKKRRNISLKK